ncbi:nucleoside/nucleotide kinase family protein [Nocardioides caldifontis]|uniref:nucleoside/nucleotide kinase family protein n=1 Tax=Nocardioides caldifontis TaxID=2588938 RepID=UPI001EF0C745|nr:nucleoside/nucleotide kinase family protein [Nocardioides caldifontis]
MPEVVRLAGGEQELRRLAERLRPVPGGRVLLGIAGEPGAGKSTLAAAVAEAYGARAAVVPMDGFHLADVTLDRLGLRDRKGAPETFDPWGYAALLGRLRAHPDHPVYAPAFERVLEQPLAGALVVAEDVELVVTEGNYLLLDEVPWRAAREHLDVVWFVEVDDAVRRRRLVARHETFGKAPDEARRWVERVDEPNAARVRASRPRADLVVALD